MLEVQLGGSVGVPQSRSGSVGALTCVPLVLAGPGCGVTGFVVVPATVVVCWVWVMLVVVVLVVVVVNVIVAVVVSAVEAGSELCVAVE